MGNFGQGHFGQRNLFVSFKSCFSGSSPFWKLIRRLLSEEAKLKAATATCAHTQVPRRDKLFLEKCLRQLTWADFEGNGTGLHFCPARRRRASYSDGVTTAV